MIQGLMNNNGVIRAFMLSGLLLLLLHPAEARQLTFAPVSGTVSSEFGWRTDPIHSKGRFHSGVDIAANHGTPIYATQSGKVIFSGVHGGYGNVVVLDHGDSLYTLFAHTAKNHVSKGQSVHRGQQIAEVGSSGRSTGPHLHFEVHYNQQYVNPVQYLASLQPAQPGTVALSAPAEPRRANQHSVGGVEMVAPQSKPLTLKGQAFEDKFQKKWTHQVEVVRGGDIELVRF